MKALYANASTKEKTYSAFGSLLETIKKALHLSDESLDKKIMAVRDSFYETFDRVYAEPARLRRGIPRTGREARAIRKAASARAATSARPTGRIVPPVPGDASRSRAAHCSGSPRGTSTRRTR